MTHYAWVYDLQHVNILAIIRHHIGSRTLQEFSTYNHFVWFWLWNCTPNRHLSIAQSDTLKDERKKKGTTWLDSNLRSHDSLVPDSATHVVDHQREWQWGDEMLDGSWSPRSSWTSRVLLPDLLEEQSPSRPSLWLTWPTTQAAF